MDNKPVVYVFHKLGANNHYTGLDYLLKQQGGRVVYREFSIISTFFKSIFKGHFKRAGKQLANVWFMLSLLFTKNRKVVVGIAPFDHKLGFILFFLKNHRVFYHNSWTVWDGSHQPRNKHITPALLQRWKKFLEQDTVHIFAVSRETKSQLMANYTISDNKISVVYHSYNNETFRYKDMPKIAESFIYAGRLLPEKGLESLLEYFAAHPQKTFTLAGRGKLEDVVVQYAQKYSNIHFSGYIAHPGKLAGLYQSHLYVLLNSFKTAKWQEAFGLVLIEAMACGAVPVATRHVGPCEVINNNVNGYLVDEGSMEALLDGLDNAPYAALQQEALKRAAQFKREVIAERWLPVL